LRLNAVCSAESFSSIVKDISLILGQVESWGNCPDFPQNPYPGIGAHST
jgi:hypothetical protein